MFLYPYIGVDICTDTHTEYSKYCVVFVSLLKISELYIISMSHCRAVLKAGYQCSRTTADYVLLLLYHNQSRAYETRSGFFL